MHNQQRGMAAATPKTTKSSDANPRQTTTRLQHEQIHNRSHTVACDRKTRTRTNTNNCDAATTQSRHQDDTISKNGSIKRKAPGIKQANMQL